MTRIKICGITTLEDALAAVEAGAHALGFNFSTTSPRAVTPQTARSIISAIPPFITTTGIFVEQSPDEINSICERCNLHCAQLHSEAYDAQSSLAVSAPSIIRVFRAGPSFHMDQVRSYAGKTGIRNFLFDAFREGQPGGTGESIEDTTAIRIFKETASIGSAILAGGLKPENVGRAIRLVSPYAVDTASGVESVPGRKDHDKIRAFVRAVQEADNDSSSPEA
ncbi:N-(5'-phosphoribosyl)anthranilate isomerase [Prosthecochloris sp. ZM]|uniref:N-(5'-phosphoribosyl)anthranilate isomerase n=1 Tax=Prosthecochloris aestuarii (strain DSM 271 / SK 413) TaxID=290512 RepID=TRPF_PROA2|nr:MULTISPECIES: phosphoribosylanthranilate isomerase [Prosthecochloris]B4S715.1 RecName: Full=N-(5'-phosphoribosyl)anthranilate isomerase; Short=PRAI [Prosthecochloris aestuarii DSM 271]ACF45852.1 Phosphoribosylanthranilate isomerase [Prosthecochloris aestuarii DSM 271]RDD30637.1 N-(5'-phosphoribosyl)anthranilate isomerase [Prosthecochloris sp. ZM]